MGVLLLAGVTSLPEIATAVTVGATGEAPLPVSTNLGSLALQVVLLAVADAAIGRDALSSVSPDPTVLVQAALNVLLLALVGAAIVAGDVPVAGVGVWSLELALVYGASVVLISRFKRRPT